MTSTGAQMLAPRSQPLPMGGKSHSGYTCPAGAPSH
jgi:hypothetical protein